MSDASWKPEAGGWRRLGHRLWRAVNEDDLFGQAAKLAFFFVLSVVPLLACVMTALGFFARDAELRGQLLAYLSAFAPPTASALIYRIVEELPQHSGGGKLSLEVVATIWAASTGMVAVIEALNVAYDVRETRPWWRARLLALTLTVGLSSAVIVGLVLLLYGTRHRRVHLQRREAGQTLRSCLEPGPVAIRRGQRFRRIRRALPVWP